MKRLRAEVKVTWTDADHAPAEWLESHKTELFLKVCAYLRLTGHDKFMFQEYYIDSRRPSSLEVYSGYYQNLREERCNAIIFEFQYEGEPTEKANDISEELDRQYVSYGVLQLERDWRRDGRGPQHGEQDR